MNKEKLIEAIVNTPCKGPDKFSPLVFQDGYLNGSAARQHEIIDIINEQFNKDWIPCEVSLPMPKGEMELYPINYVTLDTGELAIGVYRIDDKVWYTRRLEGETLYTKEHKVIAWQPLPQSYEKEGAE